MQMSTTLFHIIIQLQLLVKLQYNQLSIQLSAFFTLKPILSAIINACMSVIDSYDVCRRPFYRHNENGVVYRTRHLRVFPDKVRYP